MLTLPTAFDGSKTGLDDFLATLPEGDRLRRVEELIKPYEGGGGMSKAYTHPVTLEDVYHPPNWHMQGEALLYTDPRTEAVTVVYPGNITVTALGFDLETQQETATVAFTVRGSRRTVTAPRHELAKARGLVDKLAARGAAVHDGNARRLAGYLTEFASLNDEAIPYTPHISRLGLVGEGLVTPGGSVGTEARYEGERSLKVGTDPEAYPRALKAVLAWRNDDEHQTRPDLWPFWLALGASLASPAIARLQLRRSPVVYLSGSSGAGKTTVAQFGIGVWSDPTALPFHIEAPRTTQAGYLQTLSEAGGLPVLIDEVHAAARKDVIEGTVYQFANGMSYAKGRVEGRPAGGELLHGAVLLAGEAVVEFQNAGAARRVLYLPADTCPPLGAEPYSATGAARARVLEAAWKAGAGLLGPRVAAAIWDDWPGFAQTVRELEALFAAPCKDEGRERPSLGAWAGSVAAITATLGVLFEVLELEQPESLLDLDLRVSEALEAAEVVDPSALVFEAVLSLVALAKYGSSATGEATEGRLNGELVVWQDTGGRWCVPTGSKAFSERVGAGAVQLHGTAWRKNGLIEPDKSGVSTQSAKPPGSSVAVRVLKLKHDKV